MQEQFYFFAPVKVVKVTSQNLEEVAKWCGGTVAETESRRVPGRMDPYIWVPTPKGTKVSWAFPGMFITKRLVITGKGDLIATWAVFRRDYFEKNYFESPQDAVDQTWERENTEKNKAAKRQITVNVSVGDAMSDAVEKVREQLEEIAANAGLTNVTVNLDEQPAVEETEGEPEKVPEDAITG